jgi:Tfp pilus assembly protein PilV
MVQKNMLSSQGFLLLELLVALLLISIFTLIITSYHYSILSGNQETVKRCGIINAAHSLLEQMRAGEQLPGNVAPYQKDISYSPLAKPEAIWWIDEYNQESLQAIDLVVSVTAASKKKYSIHLQTMKV